MLGKRLRQLIAGSLFAASIACAAFAQTMSPKRVLLVYQADGTFPAFVAFEQSLAQSLRAAIGPDLDLYREQLDSTRFPEYKQHKITELRSQYADRKIQVVIFFGNIHSEILPGVPVVQVSNFPSDLAPDSSQHPNSVYVSFNIEARKIIEAARRLQP